MLKKLNIFITGAISFLLIFSIEAQDRFKFNYLTSNNGLSNNLVHDIVQDSDGFIWIATIDGLNKFDGINVEAHNYISDTTKNILSDIVTRVFNSSDKELYVGTGIGLSRYNKDSNSFEKILFNNKDLSWVTQIIETSNKELLITTKSGIYMIKDKEISKIADGDYRDITENKDDKFWVVLNEEIILIDKKGNVLKVFNNLTSKSNIDFSSRNINCIYKDSRNIIWIGTTKNGLAYYDPILDEFYNLRIKKGVNKFQDNFIRVISEDKDGKLWLGTESGLYIYEVNTQNFDFYDQSFDQSVEGLNDKAIYDIYRDKDNIMWIGTYFGGVNYTDPERKGFNKIYADGGISKLSGKAVSDIIETGDNKLWVASEDGGISIYDKSTKSFQYIRHIKGDENTLLSDNVHALEEDSKGNVWIGSFIGGINKYDIESQKLESFKEIQTSEDKLLSVFSILADNKDNIWASTLNGIYLKKDDVFEPFLPEHFNNVFIRHINEDSEGNIWLCSNVLGIYKIDKNNNVSNFTEDNTPNLNSNRFLFSFVDSKQNIWFGTEKGGLVKLDHETGVFSTYTIKDGLPNNTVHAITEDKEGKIWFSTNKGIGVLDVINNKIETYSKYSGLVGNQYNNASCCNSKDGTIYFGAVNGLTFFKPDAIKKNAGNVNIHFTDFKLFNKSVKADKKGILSSHIDIQEEITLKYSENVFTIEFLNINFISTQKIKYAYYLDGFEYSWNYVDAKNSATYTNLSPGSYTFKVKSTDENGKFSQEIREVIINVKPPFWLSVWGFLLYAIILILLAFLYSRYTHIRQKEKMDIRFAHLEKQKNEELNKHRLNFFTYISHEFKTPLSIVIATIEEILLNEEHSGKLKSYGVTIKKNAFRLLALINQLMDFRKIETDHASIKINQGDVINYIESVVESFKPLFNNKSIKIDFNASIKSYESNFDADKLEKIISNILSNSCKVSENNGKITVDIDIKENDHLKTVNNNLTSRSDLKIHISDTGPGMTEEKLSKLFDPFFSEDNRSNFSSGIGLALVNGLIKLLEGKIEVKSEHGKGTDFYISIPLIDSAPEDKLYPNKFVDKISDKNLTAIINNLEDYEPDEDTIIREENEVKYEMLIVEDNQDLSRFLHKHYSKTFKTSVAGNGMDALTKIEKSHPDIIISDVMMPVMDGNELCNTLKENIETSHIPIILLTAKSGTDSKLESLSLGADSYMNKPFNVKELDLKVKNILKYVEDTKKRFAKFDSMDESTSKMQNKELQFITSLNEIILQNINDSEFHINELCKAAYISRAHLHRKLKKSIGLSTSEFIRNVRLNEARKLLKTQKHTVSEVAFKVGYDNLGYFSTLFKKVFDEAPSFYLKEESTN